ncbi:MAG: tetraacyldisaccharide 4'-kinase [Deltaproteobacteria bacterium RBG_13_65_10]|nr:MAG: tetraacyldisaccharide 4'-kinase [Deltaproteobacteria bacterium RBG_13_65_10]
MRARDAVARTAWTGHGAGAALLRAGLAPLGAAYAVLWRIREALPRRCVRLDARVISVGNLTVGGTGKTPLAAHVSEILTRAGIPAAIVSRGYGRQSRETLVVVSDRERVLTGAARAGDEPVMLGYKLPGVPVIVCADRARAGHEAITRFGIRALVLDDAFQNRAVVKDLEIVTVDGRSPFGNGRMLPAGPLRMPPSALARADAIVITKLGKRDDPEATRSMLRAQAPRAAIFEAHTVAVELRDLHTGKAVPMDFMRHRRVVAMCALAEPRAFTDLLVEEGIEVSDSFAFPDHHVYGPDDVARVRSGARGIEAVVTTEKDAVKLDPAWVRGEPPVFSLVTAVRLDDETGFERLVRGEVGLG